jgi:hypothetical protein
MHFVDGVEDGAGGDGRDVAEEAGKGPGAWPTSLNP